MGWKAYTEDLQADIHCPLLQYNVGDDDQQDSQLVNSVYFDNSSMELYHGRLDKRPNAIALRIRSPPPPPYHPIIPASSGLLTVAGVTSALDVSAVRARPISQG